MNSNPAASPARCTQLMRAFVTISLLFLCSFSKTLKPYVLPVTIKGHIKTNPNNNSWNIKHLRVLVKANNKILAKTYTNNNGDFKLSFTPKDEGSFDFYCTSVDSDTLLIASVKTFESDTPEMFFYVPIKLQFDRKGQTICPKCKKADKAFKIVFSHPPGYDDLVKKGLIDTTRHQQGIYYCSRDKVSF